MAPWTAAITQAPHSGAIVRGDGHAFRFLTGAEDPSNALKHPQAGALGLQGWVQQNAVPNREAD